MSKVDTPKIPGDVFEESLKSKDCVKILLNYLRNLEKEVKDIHKLALSNNNQIKGEEQLADLSESIKFISDKFDEFAGRFRRFQRACGKIHAQIANTVRRAMVYGAYFPFSKIL